MSETTGERQDRGTEKREESEEVRRENLQSEVDGLVLDAAKKALEAENLELFFRLSAAGLGMTAAGDTAGNISDGLTPHESSSIGAE